MCHPIKLSLKGLRNITAQDNVNLNAGVAEFKYKPSPSVISAVSDLGADITITK